MRLVNDDREAAPDHALGAAIGRVLGGELSNDGELLQGRDDDPRRVTLKGFLELRRVFIDSHDRAGCVLQAGDRVLELTVEHLAVGDDHDLVEDRSVIGAVEARERVSGPRDRVRLAGPRRVLHEPIYSGAVTIGRVEDRAHRVPLVEPGKQRLIAFDVDERPQKVQPRVALPHLLPEVCRLIAGLHRRVTRCASTSGAAAALVEWKEDRRLTGQRGRHRHAVRVDREVHQRPGPEDQVVRVAVVPVLRHRALDVLVRQRVLQLRRSNRDPVDHQGHVERVRWVRLRVVQLTHDTKPVCGVSLRLLLVKPAGRPEEAQPHADARVLHRGPKHTDRAPMVERVDYNLEELLPRRRLATMTGDQLLPLLGLRLSDEVDDVLTEDPRLAVVCRGRQ